MLVRLFIQRCLKSNRVITDANIMRKCVLGLFRFIVFFPGSEMAIRQCHPVYLFVKVVVAFGLLSSRNS
jgi:hypothetical protein